MSVSQLEAEVSPDELHHWMALYRIEPWGEAMEWLRHGMLMSAIASVVTPSGKTPPKPTDFIPDFFNVSSR